MAAKKPARARSTVRTVATKTSVIDRHAGILKQFANYGFAGLAFGYLLTITIPEAQKSFTTTIEKQAEQNREDRKSAYMHGEKAVERIATSIESLRGTFGTVQSVTQDNQKELIRQQSRTNELLEIVVPSSMEKVSSEK